MLTKIFVIRHGNTFRSDETPRRVGAKTDIPLVESGVAQAKKLGAHFRSDGILPQVVYAGRLMRARQTAELIVGEGRFEVPIILEDRFNEIDYGPDENCTESELEERIGSEAIASWNRDATVPEGWNVDPDQLIEDWIQFADDCLTKYRGQNIFVVTSNGVARFAPHVVGDYKEFAEKFDIKLKTGAYGVLCFHGDVESDGSGARNGKGGANTKLLAGGWQIEAWNIRP